MLALADADEMCIRDRVNIGAAELKGMALATIVGIGLSLIFKLISMLRPEEVVRCV